MSTWGSSNIFYDTDDVVKAAYLLLSSGLDGENFSYAHQACASTEIGKRAVNHVMSAIGPEIGFAVREEVQHYQATFDGRRGQSRLSASVVGT